MKTDEFERELKARVAAGDLSDATASSYVSSVRQLERFASEGREWEPDPEAVMGWFEHLVDAEGLTPSTVRSHYYGIKRYADWNGRLSKTKFDDLRDELDDLAPADDDAVPPHLSDEEIDALVEGADQSDDLRVTVAVRLLVETGMTTAELASVDTDDVDTANGRVLVAGRINDDDLRDRFPLTEETVERLKDYLIVRENYHSGDSTALLVTQRGRASSDTIARFVAQAAGGGGLDTEEVSPSRIRNWVGMKLGRESFSQKQIASYLGLRSTTQARKFAEATGGNDTDRLHDALGRR